MIDQKKLAEILGSEIVGIGPAQILPPDTVLGTRPVVLNEYQVGRLLRYMQGSDYENSEVSVQWRTDGDCGPGLYFWEFDDVNPQFLPEVSPAVSRLEEATDFGAELERYVEASPELAEAVAEASIELDRESARYKDLKQRVLTWLRDKRDEDGAGCCYGLKKIADEMKCSMDELVNWDADFGVLFDLSREGSISWTAGQECVYAVGGRTTWDEY